jgi:hypothetical protein
MGSSSVSRHPAALFELEQAISVQKWKFQTFLETGKSIYENTLALHAIFIQTFSEEAHASTKTYLHRKPFYPSVCKVTVSRAGW